MILSRLRFNPILSEELMPTKKSTTAAPQANENSAVAPAMPAFSLLTTGWALGLAANKAFDKKNARAEPSDIDAVSQAWRVATDPRLIALGFIQQAVSPDSYQWRRDARSGKTASDPARSQSLRAFDLLTSGLSDLDVEALSKGIQALAIDIAKIADSKALGEAAAIQSRLLASPAADGSLSYPLLGLGLKAGKAMLAGAKVDTVTAHSLTRAGDIHGAASFESNGYSNKSLKFTELSSADWAAAPSIDTAAAAKEVSRIRGEISTQRPLLGNLDEKFQRLDVFGSLGVLDRPVAIAADLDLPQISKLAFFAPRRQSDARQIDWGSLTPSSDRGCNILGIDPSTPKSRRSSSLPSQYSLAASTLASGGWIDLLSAALVEERSGLPEGLERRAKLRPTAGHLSQARFGPWDQHGESRLLAWIDTEPLIKLLKTHGVDRWHLPTAQPKGKAAELLLGETMSVISSLHKEGRFDDANAVMARIASSAVRTTLNFGSLGQGLAGLTGILRSENPRIGLLQWAFSANAIKQGALKEDSRYLFALGYLSPEAWLLLRPESDPAAVHELDLSEAAKQAAAWEKHSTAREAWPARAKDLDASIDALFSSIALVRDAFVQSAFSSAKATETAWLAQHGMADAWRQAEAAGPVTSKSVAWCKLNPLAGSMASGNPFARCAAASARPLGFRASDSEAELMESFRSALAERGASEHAIAALESDESAIAVVRDVIANIASPDPLSKQFGSSALSFCLLSLNAWAEQGLPVAQAAPFLHAHLDPSGPFGPKSAHRATERRDALRQDGILPTLAPMAVSDLEDALAAQALLDGKAAEYPAMVSSLVRDWGSTVSRSAEQGLGLAEATSLAAGRAKLLGNAFPSAFSIDWAAKPFSSSEAWAVLGVASPRFSVALLDAELRGGAVGHWSANIAPRLGILDAADGNDVIAKTRDLAKHLLGVSDGVWRMAIKSKDSLAMLAAALESARNFGSGVDAQWATPSGSRPPPRLPSDLAAALGSKAKSFSPDRDDEKARALSLMRTLSAGWSAAVAYNVKPETAEVILKKICKQFPSLGSPSIPSVSIRSADGAAFFLAELDAKATRLPIIFKEAAKRFEKLCSDALRPPKEGDAPIDPAGQLVGEASDLHDWLSASEHGIWQTLPEKPTWGQLARLSKAWHDESVVVAADKEDRKSAALDAASSRQAADKIANEEARARSSAELAARSQAKRSLSPSEAVEQAHLEQVAAASQALKANREALAKLEAASNQFTPSPDAKWATVIGRHARDGWEAIEIDTAAGLSTEGREMSHCVSSYASDCRNGACRIFSIRLNGERLCTVEIRSKESLAKLKPDAIFGIYQNKGRHNAVVRTASTLEFCSETLALFQQAWIKITSDGAVKPTVKKEMARLKEAISTGTAELKELKAAGERDLVDRIVARRLGAPKPPKAPAGEPS